MRALPWNIYALHHGVAGTRLRNSTVFEDRPSPPSCPLVFPVESSRLGRFGTRLRKSAVFEDRPPPPSCPLVFPVESSRPGRLCSPPLGIGHACQLPILCISWLRVGGFRHFMLHLLPGAVSGGSTLRLRKLLARVARLVRPLRFLRRGRGLVEAAVVAPFPRGQ